MASSSVSFSAVLPAYNEEDALPPTVAELAGVLESHCSQWEIIVADDGSTDSTPAVCAELVEQHGDHFRTVRLEPNQGYGSALVAGIRAARYDYTFLMDSDGQFDAAQLTEFIAQLPAQRAVIGYRKNRVEGPRREFVSGVFNRIVRVLFGIRARDVDCAFRIYESALLRSLQITCKRYLVNTEILYCIRRQGVHPVQIGVDHRHRLGGETKIGFRDVPLSLIEIAKLRWRLWTLPAEAAAASSRTVASE